MPPTHIRGAHGVPMPLAQKTPKNLLRSYSQNHPSPPTVMTIRHGHGQSCRVARESSISLLLLADYCLRRGEARDGHAEGAAANVVEAGAVEEGHGLRVAAVLAADADLHARAHGAALRGGVVHELPDALGVEDLEGVVREHAVLHVVRQEGAGVVAGVAEGHLCEIVGAEGEELGGRGDLSGGERGARGLDHGADDDGHLGAHLGEDLLGDAAHDLLLVAELGERADERDHDLGARVLALFLVGHGGLVDGAGLHLDDLRRRDAEAAAAETEHRVLLLALLHGVHECGLVEAELHGEVQVALVLAGEELVQRRVEEAHGHGQAVHGLEDALEVFALLGEQLGDGGGFLLRRLREDHAAHGGEASLVEEHVLRAHEADALGAVLAGDGGVLRRVGVGEHAQAARVVGPAHEAREGAGELRVLEVLLAEEHLAGVAVDGDDVALLEGGARGERGGGRADLEVRGADDAGLAPAARDDGRVGGHAAAGGEHAERGVHAAHVLRGGLVAHEDHVFDALLLDELLGLGGGEGGDAHGGARRGRQAVADDALLVGGGARVLELRVQHLVEMVGGHHLEGAALRHEPLIEEVAGDLHGGGAVALAGAGLQHVELLLLHGELDVLHVGEVRLQKLAGVEELLVDLGHVLLHAGDGLRRADAGDDVFALRVDEVLAVELGRAVVGVAREAHARARGVADVAEDHGLHVHGGAEEALDVVDLHVLERALALPRVEDGGHGQAQLVERVIGKGHAVRDVDVLVLLAELLEVVGGKVGVGRDAAVGAHGEELLLEEAVLDAEHDVAEHVQEAAEGVVGEARIVRLGRERRGHVIVEAEVEYRVHHAGHGHGGAGAHRQEQRRVLVAEARVHGGLDVAEPEHGVLPHVDRDATALGVVAAAGGGGDGEAGRHGQAEGGHLREVRALAAEEPL
mmetsp:Transcript_37749/g.118185  ORF Transcript_37749/g.118185 Transcript_37749/m.118185 type:complete len:920 (-) Transcript_37749:644-3403(-)